MHRAKETKVIGMTADERQQVGHKKPGLALMFKTGDRAEQAGGIETDRGLCARKCVGQHPARPTDQLRLVIKQIHVRWPALHEEENDAPGPRRKVWWLGG